MENLEAESRDRDTVSEKLRLGHQEELQQLAESERKEREKIQSEVESLSAMLEEERNRAAEQQRHAKQREEDIISDLEARVKRTLQAKEDTIVELRNRCAAADNKVREFEFLLARQRE